MIRASSISVLLASACLGAWAQSLPVSIPINAPSGAVTLDPALVSFSLEQDRWTDWVGAEAPNTFFLNTLKNWADRTGRTPVIRIGANSEDHTNFDPKLQFSQATFPAPTAIVPYPEATNITVGDGYYQLASHLPQGTHVIWGVNFGQSNITAAVLQARSIKRAFESPAMKRAGVTLDYVQIGNEADLYRNNGLRDPSIWTIQQYVKEWTDFAKEVSVAAGLKAGAGPKFIGTGFASSSHSASSFSPQGAFANGLLDSAPGSLITAISQHHYSGSFCSGNGDLLQNLMTKSTIRSNVSPFIPDVKAVRARGLDYIFGETNSYSCHGAPGVSNTAGAALWTLDYTLALAQIGVTRVHFHEGIGFKYNLVQPVTLTRSILDGTALPAPQPAHVQPQYYAAMIIAEAIGKTGSARGIELAIDDPRVSGYAFYERGEIKRVVLINSQAFLSTGTAPRASKNIALNFSGKGAPRNMVVKRLEIGHADDASGLTWGGQSFETSDALPRGSISAQTVNVADGVTISDTEALLISFV